MVESTDAAPAHTSSLPASPVPSGLTAAEAARRQAELGPNEIARAKTDSPWVLFASQFKSPIIWLLVVAATVSGLLGELVDATAIAMIVTVNAFVGFFQEYRAERAIIALRSLTAPRARVMRDGRSSTLPASEVVVGDVVLLEAGDLVPADARLLQAHALSTNEASLTGESVPVDKTIEAVAAGAPLAERRDSVFLGTAVLSGTGAAEVVAIAMHTELGKIANLLQTAREGPTPLQKQLEGVARILIFVCIGIVLVVAGLSLLRGLEPFDVFLSSVSLAVAAVPEGLPAIVTIALAVGVQRIAKRNVLVRRLPSIETLGCATVICTYKTGTLTTGVMTVRELWAPDEARLIDAATACCDAELHDEATKKGVGDSTEIAILARAAESGIRRADIERERPRVSVNPFDSERKRASVLRADGVLYLKGAVEVVVELCTGVSEHALAKNSEMAARGLRVLAVAVGKGPDETGLELCGLIGLADPPRPEAIEAVRSARAAGVETVMITGDHPTTARAIARELGILREGLEADEVVHARATPKDKLDIVRA